ncbi:V8-like glu-specific endopeptidase [Globisporangium polare]
MQCTTKSRRSTPLLWAMLLVASALLSSTRGATARTAEPVGTVASHHLRRRSASLSATIASTTAASEQRRLNIFGDDDRRPVSDPSLYPYSAVGLLRWSDSLSCTASLIADKFIVTAAECALDADGNVRKSSFASPKFLPGYGVNKGGVAGTADNAEKALVVKVHKQSDYWKKWTQNTYVILELDTPIGQTYGVLQLPSLADLDQSTGKTEVQIAGYDDRATDLTKATMQYAKCTCYFPSEFNGPQYMLLHDCDTSASGSPGSPLLVRYTSMKTYIIGIHSNAIGNASMTVVDTTKPLEFSQDVANRGVLGPFIQKQLDSLVSNSTAISNSSSKSDDSASMDNGGGETPPSASSSKPTPTPKPSTDGRTGTDNGDLNPAATAKPSNGESSVNSSTDQNKRITPAAAYISITFVCLAWACILFIAVRHIRRGGAEDDEVADDDDAERIEL